MKKLLLSYCLILIALQASGRSVDTFKVHFEFNDSRISKQSEEFIDRLIFTDVLIHGQKLTVLGYTDYVGDNTYNDKLSALRAKNVQDYLIAAGFDRKDIRICIGKGKIDRAGMMGKEGYRPDRKVEIIIEKEQNTPQLPPVVVTTPPAIPQRKASAPSPAHVAEEHPTIATANLEVNATYKLSLFFENSSSAMLSKSEPQLEELFEFMATNPSVHIQIEGHICCTPRDVKEETSYDVVTGGVVSWSRAQAVYNYLLRRGIKKGRLSYIGLGSTAPLVYPEETEEDRDQNRRVEARILSK